MKASKPTDGYLIAFIAGVGMLCGISAIATSGFNFGAVLATIGCGFAMVLSLWIAVASRKDVP